MWNVMAFQRVDIYSYTAFGSEWINHEWLYVYSDPTSIVFLKNNISQREFLERLKRKEIVYPDKNSPSFYFP